MPPKKGLQNLVQVSKKQKLDTITISRDAEMDDEVESEKRSSFLLANAANRELLSTVGPSGFPKRSKITATASSLLDGDFAELKYQIKQNQIVGLKRQLLI